MPRWKRALVTGASSGIGREMALILAAEGTELVVVARDAEKLDALSSDVGGEVLVADLSLPNDLGQVIERLNSQSSPIDLLVNNAGLGFFGDFVEQTTEEKRLTVDVNVVALHELADAAARAMVEQGSGTILNVSSVAGDLPGPQTATYNATKAFVTSLSESMAMDLAPHGITVSCLCPGLTRTEFQNRASYDTSDIPEFLWKSAAEVAAAGLDGAAAGRTVVVTGVANQAWSRAIRTMPRGAARWASAKLSGR